MAKIRGPLYSMQATGTIGGLLTLDMHIKKTIARKCPPKRQLKTVATITLQSRMREAASAWRSLPSSEKNQWIALAASRRHTAFSKYFLEWHAQASTPLKPPLIPTA